MPSHARSSVGQDYGDSTHQSPSHCFVQGLLGEADRNRDGAIELKELFDYLNTQVERTARKEFSQEHTPQLLGDPEVVRGIRLVERVGP